MIARVSGNTFQTRRPRTAATIQPTTLNNVSISSAPTEKQCNSLRSRQTHATKTTQNASHAAAGRIKSVLLLSRNLAAPTERSTILTGRTRETAILNGALMPPRPIRNQQSGLIAVGNSYFGFAFRPQLDEPAGLYFGNSRSVDFSSRLSPVLS